MSGNLHIDKFKGATAILPCHTGGRSSDTCIHTNGMTLTIHTNWLLTVTCEDQTHAHQPVTFLGERRLHAIKDTLLSLQHAHSNCMLHLHDAFDAVHDATHMAIIDLVEKV